MALRIDANFDAVLRTTNLPAIAGFTLAGWVNRSGNSGTAFGVIMYLGLSDGSDYYVLYEDSSNSYNLGMGGPSVGNWSSGIPLTNGTWTHVALVCDGTGSGNLRLYINGVLAATGDGGAGPASQLMVFGGLDGGWFSGKLESFKVWGAALTEAEIAAEMQQSAPVRISNINAWYPFVQSALADNYLDLSGNGYTLTPSGTLTLETNSTLPMGQIVYIGSSSTPADNGTNVTTPIAVTPPVILQAGDLILFTGITRDSTGQTFTISQASGQTWTSGGSVSDTDIAAEIFWCRFNGTWGADPSISVTGGTSPYTAVMHVYRGGHPASNWGVDQSLIELDFTAPGSPFTVTITGQTTTKNNTVTSAAWITADDNTWDSISGTGWSISGDAQYRNTSGSDSSATFAHKIQTSPSATGNVSKNQATLGGDAGTTYIITFYEISAKRAYGYILY